MGSVIMGGLLILLASRFSKQRDNKPEGTNRNLISSLLRSDERPAQYIDSLALGLLLYLASPMTSGGRSLQPPINAFDPLGFPALSSMKVCQ
jgi:hypothetical protein